MGGVNLPRSGAFHSGVLCFGSMEDLSDELLFLDPAHHVVTNREVRLWHTKSIEWPRNQPRLRVAGELVSMSSLRQTASGCHLRVRTWHGPGRELNLEGADEADVLRQLGERVLTGLGLSEPYLTVLRLDVEAPRPVEVRDRQMEYAMTLERTYWFYAQKDAAEFRQACIDLVETTLLALIGALPAASLDD